MNPDIEMIAQFMGFDGQHEEWCGNNILVDDMFSDTGKSMTSYDPDKNWSQLMPVVNKIGELYSAAFPKGPKFIKMIMNHEDPVDKHYYDVIALPLDTPIEEAFEAVVAFIKWNNGISDAASGSLPCPPYCPKEEN